MPPEIQRGSTGEAVREAQYVLARLHRLDASQIDGVFGAVTARAVRDFQREYGFSFDGIVGADTWNAFFAIVSIPPILRDGSTGTVVKNLQRALDSIRYDFKPGPLPGFSTDGVYGPVTRTLVEAFQNWAGIPVDGVVGLRTWAVSLPMVGTELAAVVGI
jgi:peptidoglycan hydrolase-like protein with peptidoglycan-binding domain